MSKLHPIKPQLEKMLKMSYSELEAFLQVIVADRTLRDRMRTVLRGEIDMHYLEQVTAAVDDGVVQVEYLSGFELLDRYILPHRDSEGSHSLEFLRTSSTFMHGGLINTYLAMRRAKTIGGDAYESAAGTGTEARWFTYGDVFTELSKLDGYDPDAYATDLLNISGIVATGRQQLWLRMMAAVKQEGDVPKGADEFRQDLLKLFNSAYGEGEQVPDDIQERVVANAIEAYYFAYGLYQSHQGPRLGATQAGGNRLTAAGMPVHSRARGSKEGGMIELKTPAGSEYVEEVGVVAPILFMQLPNSGQMVKVYDPNTCPHFFLGGEVQNPNETNPGFIRAEVFTVVEQNVAMIFDRAGHE